MCVYCLHRLPGHHCLLCVSMVSSIPLLSPVSPLSRLSPVTTVSTVPSVLLPPQSLLSPHLPGHYCLLCHYCLLYKRFNEGIVPVSTRVITGPVSTVLITFLGFSGSKSYVYTCQQEISDVAKYVFCLPACLVTFFLH